MQLKSDFIYHKLENNMHTTYLDERKYKVSLMRSVFNFKHKLLTTMRSENNIFVTPFCIVFFTKNVSVFFYKDSIDYNKILYNLNSLNQKILYKTYSAYPTTCSFTIYVVCDPLSSSPQNSHFPRMYTCTITSYILFFFFFSKREHFKDYMCDCACPTYL